MRPVLGWLAVALALGAMPGLASEVTVGLASEDGPLGAPIFAVSVDGVVVGGGTLAHPAGVEIRTLENIGTVATTLSFPLPEGVVVGPASAVEIAMTNDSSDAAAGTDATLYITRVAIDGADADLAAATITAQNGEAMPIYTIGGGALILAWNATAHFSAPAGGWTAAAASTPAPEAPAGEAASTVETPATEATPPAPETAPPEAAPAEAAPTEATPPAEAAAPAEAVPEAAAAPTCATEASVVLMDFANGESYVTSASAQQLNAFLKGLNVDNCKLEIVGYSSPGGSADINKVVSQARADAVLDFIKRKQLGFASVSAVGEGATTQFGDATQNRRVIVTVGPRRTSRRAPRGARSGP